MKILFSVSREQLAAHRDRIFSVVRDCLPGATTEIDEARGLLCVELPDGSSEEAVEVLRYRLLTIGVSATRVVSNGHTRAHDGAQHTGERAQQEGERAKQDAGRVPPPINMEFKSPRRVRLSVFIPVLIAVALLCSTLAFSIGSAFGTVINLGGDYSIGSEEKPSENYVSKIKLIDDIFEKYGLYDTDGQLLLDEMLKAYAAATGDKYAAYYTEEELAALMTEMNGESVGIGVSVTKDPETGDILVIQVFPGSPAENAGVRPGDLIVRVGEGESEQTVQTLGYDMAMQKMLGEEGSVAHFTVLRDGSEMAFAITRSVFTSVSVTGRTSTTDQSVGIVTITSFDANTPAQFKNAMNTLIAGGCNRFVFDVRNNPGGEQRSVMTVLSYFLEENDTIMSVVSKDGTTTYYYAEAITYEGDAAGCSITKEEIGMYRDYPLVVLTNGYTASAGELFTAGLADYDLATVVGENTYGKGVIQSIYDLSSNGFKGGLKLTIGYYAPPSGENYDGVGIAPDVEVKPAESMIGKNIYLLSEEEDNQLRAAITAVLAK